jgi:hypothetical protein
MSGDDEDFFSNAEFFSAGCCLKNFIMLFEPRFHDKKQFSTDQTKDNFG